MEEFYRELDRLYAERRYDEIEEYLIKQSQIHMSCCGSVDPVQLAVYNELGSYYRNRGQAQKAVDNFRVAANLATKHCGSATAEYGTVVNNLAGAYRMLGDYDNALKNFKVAMDIYKNVFGTENFYYTSTLNNIALLYINTNELEKAEDMLNQALRVSRNTPGMEMEHAISLGNMAALFLEKGNEDQAINALEQAIAIYVQLPEDKTMHMAAACNSMGDILLKRKDFAKADDMYQKARDITKRFFGKNIEYAIACHKITLAKSQLGDIELAKDSIEEAISSMDKLGLSKESVYQDMLKFRESVK